MLFEGNYLAHYGIKGQKWGVRRFQYENGSYTPEGKERYGRNSKKAFKSPEALSNYMKKIKYKEFDTLMSPEEVQKQKRGSCHDQVMFEMSQLRKMGYDPKACFVMEYDKNQGGMTHSFVYYRDNGKVNWIENAWSERAGIKSYNSLKEIKSEIHKAHSSGEYGDISSFPKLVFGEFDDSEHVPGETLQELVDKCLK